MGVPLAWREGRATRRALRRPGGRARRRPRPARHRMAASRAPGSLRRLSRWRSLPLPSSPGRARDARSRSPSSSPPSAPAALLSCSMAAGKSGLVVLATASLVALSACGVPLLASLASDGDEGDYAATMRRALDDLAERELSDREREVLVRTLCGEPRRVIAQALDVSESTVGTNRTRGYEKLGVSSKVELVSRVSSWTSDAGSLRPDGSGHRRVPSWWRAPFSAPRCSPCCSRPGRGRSAPSWPASRATCSRASPSSPFSSLRPTPGAVARSGNGRAFAPPGSAASSACSAPSPCPRSSSPHGPSSPGAARSPRWSLRSASCISGAAGQRGPGHRRPHVASALDRLRPARACVPRT